MSQTLLTNFFHARKRGADDIQVKKRKREQEQDVDDKQENKVDVSQNIVISSKEENVLDVVHVPSKNNSNPCREDGLNPLKEDNSNNSKQDIHNPSNDLNVAAENDKEDTAAPDPETPSTSKDECYLKNPRCSKKEMKEPDWTPTSSSPHLERPRNVSFHKLSNLSPRKMSSPSKLDYTKLNKQLTPLKIWDSAGPSPAKRPAVSRNLFSDESEVSAKKSALAEAVIEAKKVKARLSPLEVKQRLGNVKLKDLKARLATLDRSGKIAASLSKTEALKPTGRPSLPPTSLLMKLETPRTPTKCQSVYPTASPLKSSTKATASPRKTPAFKRFHSLTKPLDRSLPMCYNYRLLADVFRAVDSTVAMFYNRKELITVAKLCCTVQDMTKRPFLPCYLPQIRCLFPEAFHFTWEKVERFNKVTHSLQVVPNLSYKRSLMGGLGETPVLQPTQHTLTSEHLVERRQIFSNSLLQLMKDQHAEFLSNLKPPIVIDDSLLTAWHKDFNVDSCLDVEELALPPHPDQEPVQSLKEPLEDEQEIEATEKGKENTEEISNSGLPASLLAKIRAKEAAKAIREMTRTEAEKKRISCLRKLPGHARFMRTLLISERKASVTVQFAVTKLMALSPHGTEKKDLEEELRTLVVESEGWLSLHRVALEDIFKIAKPHRINETVRLLDEKLSEALK